MNPATMQAPAEQCVRDPAALRREVGTLLDLAGNADSRELAELLHNVAGFVSTLANHDVDDRGRCRGCRRPDRRLLWRRRQPCPLCQACGDRVRHGARPGGMG